MNNNVMGQLHP